MSTTKPPGSGHPAKTTAPRREINLYDPSLRAVRDYLTLPALLTAVAAGSALILGGHLLARESLAEARKAAAESEARIGTLRERMLADTRALTTRAPDSALQTQLETERSTLLRTRRAADQIKDTLKDQEQRFSEVFKALARRTAPGVWLGTVDISRGARLAQLQGQATHEALIPDYIASLRREPALAGLPFAQLTVDAAPREGATPAATPPAQRFTLSNIQTARGAPLPATGNGEAAR